MSDTTERRPAGVSVAVWLLGICYAAYVGLLLVGNIAEPPAFEGGTPGWFLPVLIAVSVAACGLAFGLLAAVYCRRHWAYIILLVVMLLWLARTAQAAVADGAAGTSVLVYVPTFVILAAALALLVRRPVRGWYRPGEARSQSAGQWLPDPAGRHQHRYWDGRAWTDHVADEGVAALEPLAEPVMDVRPTSGSS